MDRHSISEPRLVVHNSETSSSEDHLPNWVVDIFRDNVPNPVDTILINEESLPPRVNKKGRVVWRLPSEPDRLPTFGSDERRRILEIFRERKKKRKKLSQATKDRASGKQEEQQDRQPAPPESSPLADGKAIGRGNGSASCVNSCDPGAPLSSDEIVPAVTDGSGKNGASNTIRSRGSSIGSGGRSEKDRRIKHDTRVKPTLLKQCSMEDEDMNRDEATKDRATGNIHRVQETRDATAVKRFVSSATGISSTPGVNRDRKTSASGTLPVSTLVSPPPGFAAPTSGGTRKDDVPSAMKSLSLDIPKGQSRRQDEETVKVSLPLAPQNEATPMNAVAPHSQKQPLPPPSPPPPPPGIPPKLGLTHPVQPETNAALVGSATTALQMKLPSSGVQQTTLPLKTRSKDSFPLVLNTELQRPATALNASEAPPGSSVPSPRLPSPLRATSTSRTTDDNLVTQVSPPLVQSATKEKATTSGTGSGTADASTEGQATKQSAVNTICGSAAASERVQGEKETQIRPKYVILPPSQSRLDHVTNQGTQPVETPHTAVSVAKHFLFSVYYPLLSAAASTDLLRYYEPRAQKSISINGAHSVVTGYDGILRQLEGSTLGRGNNGIEVRGVVAMDLPPTNIVAGEVVRGGIQSLAAAPSSNGNSNGVVQSTGAAKDGAGCGVATGVLILITGLARTAIPAPAEVQAHAAHTYMCPFAHSITLVPSRVKVNEIGIAAEIHSNELVNGINSAGSNGLDDVGGGSCDGDSSGSVTASKFSKVNNGGLGDVGGRSCDGHSSESVTASKFSKVNNGVFHSLSTPGVSAFDAADGKAEMPIASSNTPGGTEPPSIAQNATSNSLIGYRIHNDALALLS